MSTYQSSSRPIPVLFGEFGEDQWLGDTGITHDTFLNQEAYYVSFPSGGQSWSYWCGFSPQKSKSDIQNSVNIVKSYLTLYP